MDAILTSTTGWSMPALVLAAGTLLVLASFADNLIGRSTVSDHWRLYPFIGGTAMLGAAAIVLLFDVPGAAGGGTYSFATTRAAAQTLNRAHNGKGFDCERYGRKDIGQRTPQRDVLCATDTARNADREMSSHFKAYRNASPGDDYRAITDAHLAWMARRDAKCAATWDDLRSDRVKRELGDCLENETRLRTAQIKTELAKIAQNGSVASALPKN